MAINKIKLKQIDADFPTLVGQYGSGYFASTGSLNSLSGQSVKYSDLATGAFVYTTGSQNISGSKNFMSRPAISGVGIATLGEIVSINGNNAIFGENTFFNKTISLGISEFSSGVTFNNSTFQFIGTSLNNLTNSIKKIIFDNNTYNKHLNSLPDTIEYIKLPKYYNKKIHKIPVSLKIIKCRYNYEHLNNYDKNITIEIY
jgi:hypothetical protein